MSSFQTDGWDFFYSPKDLEQSRLLGGNRVFRGFRIIKNGQAPALLPREKWGRKAAA